MSDEREGLETWRARGRVVHVGTLVQCVFGTVDEEGNLRQLAPLELQVTSLQPEQFQAVLEHLLGQREALEQQRAESEGQRAGERNPSRFALEPEAGALPPDGHPARPKGA